jgi:hypothetical protein
MIKFAGTLKVQSSLDRSNGNIAVNSINSCIFRNKNQNKNIFINFLI